MGGSPERIRVYREMLKLDPSSRVFAMLAEELCASGDWEEAAQVCRRGLRFHPGNMRPRVLLGLALMELGEVEESERILLEVQEEMRRSSVTFKVLAELASHSGNDSLAAEFSRIYDAFQPPRAERQRSQEPDAIAGAADAVTEEATAKNALGLDPPAEAAAVEEAAVETAVREPSEDEPAKERLTPEQLDRLLTALAERMESMLSEASIIQTPLFSQTDRDIIKLTILADLA